MRERIQRMMAGRYGMDALGKCLSFIICALLLVSFFYRPVLFVGFGLLLYQYFRIFSKNRYRRYAENQSYLKLSRSVSAFFRGKKQRFAQRREYVFFRCSCKQMLRVPRGRGKLSVSCPKCQAKYTKKT